MSDHAIRMLREAETRIADAAVLSQSMEARSDSAALLKILGFEVLLKCAVLLHGCKPGKSHNYVALWRQLPSVVRDSILASARDRMPGTADLSDPEALLRNYRFVFEKARYYYEFYESYSLDEQQELGQLWLDRGAPESEAEVKYHPEELECLIHGLRVFIHGKLVGGTL